MRKRINVKEVAIPVASTVASGGTLSAIGYAVAGSAVSKEATRKIKDPVWNLTAPSEVPIPDVEEDIDQLLMETADPLPVGPGEWQGPPELAPKRVPTIGSSSTRKVPKQLLNTLR